MIFLGWNNLFCEMFSFLILLIQSYSESKSEFYEEYLEKDVYTVDVFYRITCKTKKTQKRKKSLFYVFCQMSNWIIKNILKYVWNWLPSNFFTSNAYKLKHEWWKSNAVKIYNWL